MSVFAAYSSYYDLLYRDKDYGAEADFVAGKLRRFGCNAHSVLELGCGTGAHASLLAARGYEVHGVDMSEGMLAAAHRRRDEAGSDAAESMTFSLGDVRTVRLGRTFDAVMSLFHVFSYQTSNEDLRAAFATAKAHLRPGGILLFDCWYGPAVLTIGPSTTVKRLEDGELRVTRIAEPVLRVNDNVVDVKYDVIVTGKEDGVTHRLSEMHSMRYLFMPEVRQICGDLGMEIVDASVWMGDEAPNSSTWAACFVASL